MIQSFYKSDTVVPLQLDNCIIRVKQSTNLHKREKNDGLLKDYKPLNRLIFNKSEGLKDFSYQTESRSFFGKNWLERNIGHSAFILLR